MLAYAVRRILIGIVVLLVSTFVVFLMVSFSGNPLGYLLGRNPPPSPHVVHLEAHRLHLDQPLLERYVTWLGGVLHGDFGPSVHHNTHIGPELLDRFIITMRLIGLAMLVALLLAVLVGVMSAVKQYSARDYTATFLGFLFLAMPSFWLALLLKQAGIDLNNVFDSQIFYTIGDTSVYVQGGTWAHIKDILGHMILPTISLALISFASWSRYCRGSMLEVLNSDYVRLARAKGLSRSRVMIKHAFRTALIPLTTVTALDLAAIISGAVITETVFQWHGMGDLLITSIKTFDVYAVLGWLLVSAATVIAFNLIADLLYAVLDPRIRYD
ncbi:MAG: ABC transporter permease [Streptosporangiaceae bacterium]